MQRCPPFFYHKIKYSMSDLQPVTYAMMTTAKYYPCFYIPIYYDKCSYKTCF